LIDHKRKNHSGRESERGKGVLVGGVVKAVTPEEGVDAAEAKPVKAGRSPRKHLVVLTIAISAKRLAKVGEDSSRAVRKSELLSTAGNRGRKGNTGGRKRGLA
jgi:hypothetical protein